MLQHKPKPQRHEKQQTANIRQQTLCFPGTVQSCGLISRLIMYSMCNVYTHIPETEEQLHKVKTQKQHIFLLRVQQQRDKEQLLMSD